MWEERFGEPEYHFGTEPAAFLTAQAHHIPAASRVLAVADGEGRNSVWLAEQGHHVVAFDAAENGVAKARKLAEARGVSVDLHTARIEDWDWAQDTYDAVVAIFFQFAPPPLRAQIFAGLAQTLRPGGVLLLHGYAPRQVGYGTGGAPWPEHLYTLELLHEAFPGWEILREADYDAEIQEGRGHAGLSALVDFVALKPVA